MLASGMDDGSIEIWDTFTGERQINLPGSSQNPIRAVSFSHNSALLALIASRPEDEAHMYRPHQALEFWNVSTGLCLATVDINSLALSHISFDEMGPCLSTSVGEFILKGMYYSGSVCRGC